MNADNSQSQQQLQPQSQPQSQQQEKHFVVELNSGEKCDGILVNIDKLNYKIQLKNVKKYSVKIEGNEDKNPEEFEILNIDKSEIKEVQLIQFEQKEEKPTEVNVNAIPQDKIPTASKGSMAKTKNYDKNESFFDSLASMSHPQAKEESRNYNNKNTETFNLPNEQKDDQGYQRGRGGRGRGGRGQGKFGRGYHQNQYQLGGGYNKGYYGNQQGGYNQIQQGGFNQGFYQNNHHQYQQNQGYNKPYNQDAFNQGRFNEQQGGYTQGYNNYHHTQGRGRGRGRGGRGQGYNYNNRGAFNKGYIDFNQHQYQPQDMKNNQDSNSQQNSNKSEVEKTIYDEEKK